MPIVARLRGYSSPIVRFRHEVGIVNYPTDWQIDEALARQLVPELPSLERLKGATVCLYFVKICWNLCPWVERVQRAANGVSWLASRVLGEHLASFSVDTPAQAIAELTDPLPPYPEDVTATYWAEVHAGKQGNLMIQTHQSGRYAGPMASDSILHLTAEGLRSPDSIERKSILVGLQHAVQNVVGAASRKTPAEAWVALAQAAAYRCVWWDNTGELGENWRMAPPA